jgi:transcriptional regulator with XRE-family HTH domain
MDKPKPIQAARKWAGYESANQAARALGLDQSAYNKMEKGDHKPSADTLVRLARGFGCKTDHLLGLEDLPPRAEVPTPAAS